MSFDGIEDTTGLVQKRSFILFMVIVSHMDLKPRILTASFLLAPLSDN